MKIWVDLLRNLRIKSKLKVFEGNLRLEAWGSGRYLRRASADNGAESLWTDCYGRLEFSGEQERNRNNGCNAESDHAYARVFSSRKLIAQLSSQLRWDNASTVKPKLRELTLIKRAIGQSPLGGIWGLGERV